MSESVFLTVGRYVGAAIIYGSVKHYSDSLPEGERVSDQQLQQSVLEFFGLRPPAPPVFILPAPPRTQNLLPAKPSPSRKRRPSRARRRPIGARTLALPAPQKQIAAAPPEVKPLEVRFRECLVELHEQSPKMKLSAAIDYVRPVAKSIFSPAKKKNPRAGRPKTKHDFTTPEHAPNVETVMRRWFVAYAKKLSLASVPDDVRQLFRDSAHVGRGWWSKEIRSIYPDADGDFVNDFRDAVYQLKNSLL